MTKIIQFKQQELENCDCDLCDLVSDYIDDIEESESREELFAKLRALVAEAQYMAVLESLENEIEAKQELYNRLVDPCGNCDCEDCCELED